MASNPDAIIVAPSLAQGSARVEKPRQERAGRRRATLPQTLRCIYVDLFAWAVTGEGAASRADPPITGSSRSPRVVRIDGTPTNSGSTPKFEARCRYFPQPDRGRARAVTSHSQNASTVLDFFLRPLGALLQVRNAQRSDPSWSSCTQAPTSSAPGCFWWQSQKVILPALHAI